MSLHSGSRKLAHNLDRFSLSNFEEVAGEAARLGVSMGAVRRYMDWYGDGSLTVQQVRSNGHGPRRQIVTTTQLPAYEVRLRQDLLGERLTIRQQERSS